MKKPIIVLNHLKRMWVLLTLLLLASCTPASTVPVTMTETVIREVTTPVTTTATVTRQVTTPVTTTVTVTREVTIPTTSLSPTTTATTTTAVTQTPTKPSKQVGGIIAANTTWSVTESPYLVIDTIQIPNGVTLTIEPGVMISKTTKGNMFLLLGKIHAHGTAQEPITFDGGGNTIIGTYPVVESFGDFEYCVFKNGFKLWDRWGQIAMRYSEIINITTGSKSEIGGACIQLDQSSGDSSVEYNTFINTGGIVNSSGGGFNIKYNLFQKLRSPIWGFSPKIVVKYNSFVDTEGMILWGCFDAASNYWGTTDTTVIDLKIYDGNDDVTINGRITYLPILTSPDPKTPTP